MKKLAVLANIVAPARLPILSYLAKEFDTLILHGGNESNRNWEIDPSRELKTRKVFTIQITMHRRSGVSGVPDKKYFHMNLGLLWWLPRFGPDVILSYEMGLRTALAVLYGKLTGVPVWVWWGGTLHTERFTSRIRKLFRSVLVREVDHWISYGVSTTEYLESIGIPRTQILQSQNCVAQEAFESVPSNPETWFDGEPRPVILTVGQLVPRKGLNALVEACGRLRVAGREFTLVIVGEGPDRAQLEQLAAQCNLTNFHILPNKSQSTLNEMYRAADVFVFPTLEDVWGLVVNEALWTGARVLCSKYAGCAPEVIPAQNVFDPLKPQDFDAALKRIFDGTVLAADKSRLRTWQQVAAEMARSLQKGVSDEDPVTDRTAG